MGCHVCACARACMQVCSEGLVVLHISHFHHAVRPYTPALAAAASLTNCQEGGSLKTHLMDWNLKGSAAPWSKP